MKEFDFIEEYFDWARDHDEEIYMIIDVIMKFKKFPSNLVNARGKRIDMLRCYISELRKVPHSRYISVNMIRGDLIRKYEDLINSDYKDRWAQQNVRKRIKNIKKYSEDAIDMMTNTQDYWCSDNNENNIYHNGRRQKTY